ncbi:uncharacterized protein [Dysidea avara]|uniref:uncharacterized protein isoform X4 n=1 Tax=Dysidea avara TaxID=196820 RepID=UPI00331A95B0
MVPKTTCQHVQLRLEEGLVLVLMLKMSTLFVEYVKAASSQVQREIKVTFEDVFQYVINCWLKDSSKFDLSLGRLQVMSTSRLIYWRAWPGGTRHEHWQQQQSSMRIFNLQLASKVSESVSGSKLLPYHHTPTCRNEGELFGVSYLYKQAGMLL